MSLSELLAASGTNNPSPGRQSIQIRRHPLT